MTDNSLQNAAAEIRADIDVIKTDASLFEDANYNARTDAIDFLEFHIIDRISGLGAETALPGELILLERQAHEIKSQLEQVNMDLFIEIRQKILAGDCQGQKFIEMVQRYTGLDLPHDLVDNDIGYDNLDIFMNGLLAEQDIPDETITREPEMVFYQKTPARVVLEMINQAQFSKKDVFFDIGSGLGQVPILVKLATEATCFGVDFETAYCQYATAAAATLGLEDISFINSDARSANYSKGTVFFMYTPFGGAMLQEVLDKLAEEAAQRPIRIFTYGPCTAAVARQSWLSSTNGVTDDPYALASFKSHDTLL